MSAELTLELELENILICNLKGSIKTKLGELLDEIKVSTVENGIPRDYRGLAQLVGLDTLDILGLEKVEQPTDRLLYLWWKKEPNCKVGKLIEHLEKLKCYYVLDEVIPMLASSHQPLSPVIVHITPRNWWNRKDVCLKQQLSMPLGFAYLQHTGKTEDATQPLDDVVRRLQEENIAHGNFDIDCNFVVSPDGRIVEGTGWYMGDSPARFNHTGISITMLGDFSNHEPDPLILEATNNLLQELVRQGKLERDFGLYGVCDVSPTTSPGSYVMKAIASWPCFHKKGMLQQADWPTHESLGYF